MATEQPSPVATEYGSLPKWGSWLAALVGLWVLMSPFVLSGPIGGGTPMYSNAIAGVVVLVLAAVGASAIRAGVETSKNTPGELSGWIAGLVGIWMIVTPFVLNSSIDSGAVMWSNATAGVIAFILAGYTGYYLHSGE